MYPAEVAHCNVCSWSKRCEQRREDDDYLGLVAGIRTEQIAKLADAGITAMTALAQSTQRPHRMSETTYMYLRTQAALQLGQRRAMALGDPYPYAYKLRDLKPEDPNDKTPEPSGFARLPLRRS